MATEIIVNAKCQRPSVCNAAETLLIHQEVAEAFLPTIEKAWSFTELRADERALAILKKPFQRLNKIGNGISRLYLSSESR